MIKKMLSFMMLMSMGLGLVACSNQNKVENVTGATVDVGQFTVMVPDGWTALKTPDNYAGEGTYYDDRINVYHGDEQQAKLLTTQKVEISYSDIDDVIYSATDILADIDKVQAEKLTSLQNYDWQGYFGYDEDYHANYIILEAGGTKFDLSVYLKTDAQNLQEATPIDDVETLAIINSIKIN